VLLNFGDCAVLGEVEGKWQVWLEAEVVARRGILQVTATATGIYILYCIPFSIGSSSSASSAVLWI
jgi:hypothetical protein